MLKNFRCAAVSILAVTFVAAQLSAAPASQSRSASDRSSTVLSDQKIKKPGPIQIKPETLEKIKIAKIIASFTNKDGSINYKALASFLEKKGNPKLIASVIKSLITVTNRKLGAPGHSILYKTDIDSSKAEALINELSPSMLKAAAKALSAELEATRKKFGFNFKFDPVVIGLDLITKRLEACPAIPPGMLAQQEISKIIDQFRTEDGNIDYKKLASYMEKKQNPVLAANIIKSLIAISNGKILPGGAVTQTIYIDSSKAEALISALSPAMLKAAAKMLAVQIKQDKWSISGESMQAKTALNLINKRIEALKSIDRPVFNR